MTAATGVGWFDRKVAVCFCSIRNGKKMSNPHDSSLPNALRDRGLTTFCVNRRRREMYCGHERLCVCVPVCLSVRGRTPTLLHAPGCNLGAW